MVLVPWQSFSCHKGSWPDPFNNVVALLPGPKRKPSPLQQLSAVSGWPPMSVPRSQDANCHNPQACSSSFIFAP
jgi:hypothetical protein